MAEVNSELKTTNDLLKEVLKNLGAINKETDKTPGRVSKAIGGLKTIMGGGSRGNGTGGSSQMDHMEGKFGSHSDQSSRIYHEEAMSYTARFTQTNRTLGIAQAGAAAVFGVAAGAAAMVPTIAEVSGQAGNYYGASLAAGGMSRQAINQATFSGLAGGITSTLGPSTSAAILAARGYTPGSAQYNATISQIGGAARYMNMANESAAVAMSGMTQGNMASNLYAAGISSYNQGTGQMRSSQEIFGQLYDRMTQGQSKMSTNDINNSIQAGLLGQQTSALGMSEDQKQLFFQYFRDRQGGGSGDLGSKGYGANPMGDKMRLTTSDTSVLNAYEKPMLEGFKNATDLIVNKVNPALESVADTAGKAAGFLGGLSESRAGAGLGVMFGSLIQSIGMLTTALMASAIMGGRSPMGAVAGGAKMLLKGGLVAGAGYMAGNAIKGDSKQGSVQSRGGNAVAGAGIGAGIGMFVGMPLVGAAIGGLIGYATGGPNDTGTSGSFGGTASITGGVSPATPIVGGQVGSGYREKGPMWSSRGHSGLDYPCPVGTPVVAALDGVVYDDNLGAAYGTYIQIDHGNGYQTIYGHLSEKMVSVGSTVTKGQVIGKSGDTGHVTGPHLHFEVRKGKNNTVNPSELKGASTGGVAAALSTLIGGGSGSMEVTNSGVKVSDTASSKIYGSKLGSELAAQALSGGLNIGLSTGNAAGTAASSIGNALPANADASIVATLQAAGFTGSALATAYGIVRAESGGRPDAHNGNAGTGDNSYGLFQINMLGDMGPARRQKFGLSTNEDLFDPLTNAKVAYAISNQGTNFRPWTTYTSEKYKQFTAGGAGGGEAVGVATPSMGGGGTATYAPHITINASFTGTSEAEAMKLVQIVRTELEKSAERRSSGSK